ncbi:MAG TPA: hypothetical protein VFG04_26140, partial [Planctomycetaceae bacterium]|nr:hypothetical protein [Planctomycetaceae bacterium]
MTRSFVRLPTIAAAAFGLVCVGGWPSQAGTKSAPLAPVAAPHGMIVEPKQVDLVGNFARAQLVASAADPSGVATERSADLTAHATFTSSDAKVVRVDGNGTLYAVGNGTAEVVIALKSSNAMPSVRVRVNVKDVAPSPGVSYSRDIVPIIAKAGCNMGACHASQYGKAGFKLSVFGYEPTQDYAAIVRDRSER